MRNKLYLIYMYCIYYCYFTKTHRRKYFSIYDLFNIIIFYFTTLITIDFKNILRLYLFIYFVYNAVLFVYVFTMTLCTNIHI